MRVQPAATSGGEQVTHVVQPGESLLQIATEEPDRFGRPSRGQWHNQWQSDPCRPEACYSRRLTRRQALEACGTRYVVQSGESLSVIAEKYGVTVEAIMAANGIDDPNTIKVGQELLIPAARARTECGMGVAMSQLVQTELLAHAKLLEAVREAPYEAEREER